MMHEPPADDPERAPTAPEPDPAAVENLWRVHAAISEWIRFADTKAGALLAADILLASVVPVLLRLDKGDLFQGPRGVDLAIIAVLMGFSLIVSAGFCLWCIRPRTRIAPGPAPTIDSNPSLLHFGQIADAHDSADDYAQAARVLAHPAQAQEQLARQVWAISRVARDKHKAVGLAVVALACGLFFGLLAWSTVMWSLYRS